MHGRLNFQNLISRKDTFWFLQYNFFFATVKGTKYKEQRNESKLIKGYIDCGKFRLFRQKSYPNIFQCSMGTIFTLLNFFVVDLKHEITTDHFKEDVWWIFQDIKESVYIAISKKLKMNQNAHFIVFYYNKNKFSDYPKNIKINITLYWYLVRQSF